MRPEGLRLYRDESTGGLPSKLPDVPSSEGFAKIPFYRTLNQELLKLALPAHRVLDLATGTGPVVGWLQDLGKLLEPFHVTGIDLNEADLEKARERFSAFGDRIKFIQGNAEDMHEIPDSSVDLVTGLNFIHLCADPQKVFNEIFRVLEKGKEALVNSAYVRKIAIPDRRAFLNWQYLIRGARQWLEKEHKLINISKPDDVMRYTIDQYREMAEKAGFHFKTETYTARIPREEAKELVSVEEFAVGAIPGVALDITRTALRNGVDIALDETKSETIDRGWASMRLIKPLAAAA